jgi:SAM-dependent methyltransferase
MSSRLSIAEGTFRDPAGRLYHEGDRILREIYPQHVASVTAWIESPLARHWMQQHRVVSTVVLAPSSAQPALLEHERVFFPTYPWEWAPSQWIDAASLTLDLCEEALEDGFILKDATPLNILFSGSQAVFVDVLSFVRRDPQCPLWMAYAQFVRTFLLPLCAYAYCGWPLSATLQTRDGYEPADLAPYLSTLKLWRRPLRSLVALPMLFEKNRRVLAHNPRGSEEVSLFTLRRLLGTTRALLHSLAPSRRISRWSRYTETACHYEPADHSAKQAFVRNALGRIRAHHVLDVGANTGVYSGIAAETGSHVVAWDTDVQATDLNWQAARNGGLSILPMVADFARPTPAVGWRNRESTSLLERARGQFDCVMMLGILHHLLVADQIPLAALIAQLWEISNRWAIVEWIPAEDAQFEGLCRGRQELYRELNEGYFIHRLSLAFNVIERGLLRNGRSLWLLERIP